MKLKDIETLLRAAKAKSQIETARLAAIRTAQVALLDAASAFDKRSRAELTAGDMTGAEVAHYGRHQAFAERSASKKRAAAAELEPLRFAQDGKLRKALQEEIAWERLEDDALTARRVEREAREEERREMLARKR